MAASLAQEMRLRLDELATEFVRQLQQANLPDLAVLAQPVLQQSARQLYAALIESLETGDAQFLSGVAVQQARMRHQQGVGADDLAQIGRIYAAVVRDWVAGQFRSSRARANREIQVEPLLRSLMSAFGADPESWPDVVAELSQSGGKDMSQDRYDSKFDQEQLLRQLETSIQVSRQLTAALDLDELLLQVVELIKGSFNYYHVHVYLLDPESGSLIMRDGTGEAGKAMKERGHRIELGRGLVGRVGQTGEPVLVSDVSQNPQWLPNPLLPDTRSELTVPLKIGERVLGVLDVQSNEIGGVTESDLRLMESLGQQIAVAVDNAMLFRETRAVSIISRAVSSGLSWGEVFAAISRELKALINFDYMTIATYYEIADQIELEGVDDRTEADIPLEAGVQLPANLCIPGLAVKQKCSIIVPDLKAEQFNAFIDAEIWVKRGMCSVLSVPLFSQGQIAGAINLVSGRERAFTTADAHLMERVSGQLATALANARIFENIQQMVTGRTAEMSVFRTVTENADEAIVLTNLEQMLTYANPAFYRMYGYDPTEDDLSRRPFASFIVTDDVGALGDDIRDRVLRGENWHAEMRHGRKDGTRFTASAVIFGIRDEAGELSSFAAVIRDVTAERKLMAISQAASSTPELERLAPLVLEQIAVDTDVDRILMILYENITEDGPQTIHMLAVYDPEGGGRRLLNQRLPVEQSPFSALVYFEKSPIFVADIKTDERLSEKGRELLLEYNLASMLALPIWVRNKIVGMVGIDWRKHVELTAEQVALYQTMVNLVSTAVENARLIDMQQAELERALDRRVRESATSIEVGQAIATAPQLEELFTRVVTLIKERFGYYHAHVYQIDRVHGDLEMMAGYGEPGRIMKERGHRIPVSKGLVGTAATTGQPVRVSDVSEQPNWLSNPLLPETKSELAVPIKLGSQVLGVLDVQSDRLNGLTEDDELLLLGLCGQIATSINNTQLVQQLQDSQMAAQQRAHQLELSIGVSEQLAATLSLDDLLAKVVLLIQEGFDYYQVHVYLIQEDTGDLVFMEGTGEPGSIMKEQGYRVPIGQGLVGQVAQTGMTVLASDTTKQEGWQPHPLLPKTQSEIAIPLKVGNIMLGVLDVHDVEVHGLDEEDRALLEGLAGQIAVAVQNALNFRSIEAQVAERTRDVRSFQSLAENATDAILMADLNGVILFANQASYDLYGYDRRKNDLAGLPMSELWPAESRDVIEQAIAQGLVSGWRGRVSQVCRNGRRVAVSLILFAVRDDRGRTVAIAASGRDMTTDELVERVGQLAAMVTSLSQLGVELLRVIVQGVSVDRGYFVLYEGDDQAGPRTAHLLASFDEKAPDVVPVDVVNNFDVNAIHRYLYNARKPIVFNSPRECDEQLIAICQALKSQVFAAFPFVMQGRVSGMLLVDRLRDEPFTDSEISFFTSILQQVSLIISNFILRDAQRAEIQRELERRTQETLTTTEVAQAIAAATELGELFRRIVTLVKERFNYYHVHLYEFVPERKELVLVAGYGEPGRIMVERGHRIALGRGLNSAAVLTKKPVLVPDVREREDWLPNPLLPDTQSELAVPIIMGDEVLGVLDVQQNAVGGLTEADQSLLLNLCGQIASAMQNTRLLERTQVSLHRTDLLLGLSTALSSLTDPHDIANALAEQMMGIVSIERCAVALCEDYDEQNIPRKAQVCAIRDRDPGFQGALVLHQLYALSDYPALLRQLVQQRQVVIVNDLGRDDQLDDAMRDLMQREGAVSFVIVPMVSGDRVLGYFMLTDREQYTFSEDDLELYLGIASQSAIAFSNALLLSQVRLALEDQSRLYESSRAIAMATTLEVLSEAIIRQIVTTNVDRCAIVLFERHGRRKAVSIAGGWSGKGERPQVGTRLNADESPLYALFEQFGMASSHVITDDQVALLPEKARALFAEGGIKALALVPLIAGEESIGFIAIERHLSSSFNSDAVRLYETIASQSAVALRNVQLIAESQRQLVDLQKSYDEVARLADTIRQLSSPVIQIWQDVLVLPLVGTIDSQRAARIMEDLLTGITRFQAEQVIIDVTGVPVMDEAVVNHLLQTIKAAALLGAKCMLVGINSEKAQTIVNLGLDWRGVRTFSNLRAGIQAALQQLGFVIAPLSLEEGKIS